MACLKGGTAGKRSRGWQSDWGNQRKNGTFLSAMRARIKKFAVLPLAQLLRNGGLKVWIDQAANQVGDSLRNKIDQGLAGSRFGIVILSPSFPRIWPTRELNGLSAMEGEWSKVILPVWHDITLINCCSIPRCLPTVSVRHKQWPFKCGSSNY